MASAKREPKVKRGSKAKRKPKDTRTTAQIDAEEGVRSIELIKKTKQVFPKKKPVKNAAVRRPNMLKFGTQTKVKSDTKKQAETNSMDMTGTSNDTVADQAQGGTSKGGTEDLKSTV